MLYLYIALVAVPPVILAALVWRYGRLEHRMKL
jgi:hypothetical protein